MSVFSTRGVSGLLYSITFFKPGLSLCHGLVLDWGWMGYKDELEMASSLQCQEAQGADKAVFSSVVGEHHHQNR